MADGLPVPDALSYGSIIETRMENSRIELTRDRILAGESTNLFVQRVADQTNLRVRAGLAIVDLDTTTPP